AIERGLLAVLMITICVGFVRWTAGRAREKGSGGILMSDATRFQALPSHAGDVEVHADGLAEGQGVLPTSGFGDFSPVRADEEAVPMIPIKDSVSQKVIKGTSSIPPVFNHGIPSPPSTPDLGSAAGKGKLPVLDWFGGSGGGVLKDETKSGILKFLDTLAISTGVAMY
ncbi:hypothetical protein HDU76_008654, partial [Blyttiomyces sp. JEL0837]